MEFRYVTADVFTDKPFGGNQLAVFPDATGIPEEHLLPITREFNYSETTFCYPPADKANTRRVRIFTPGGEVPFAGHPTVGTAHALVATRAVRLSGAGGELVLEEGVGPVRVKVTMVDGAPTFAQFAVAKLPEIGPPSPSRGVLAKMLSLETNDVVFGAHGPQAISCGLPFLIVPVRDVAAVSRARMRMEAWEETLKASSCRDIMVFAADPTGGDTHFRARVFVPGFGVPEDPATGSANACLAGYLAARATEKDGSFAWTVDQGIEMGRPSRLHIEADKAGGEITAVRVGGATVMMSEGSMSLPDNSGRDD